jgi:hypothetical protein
VRSRAVQFRWPDPSKPLARDACEQILLLERMHAAALANQCPATFSLSLTESIRLLHEARHADIEVQAVGRCGSHRRPNLPTKRARKRSMRDGDLPRQSLISSAPFAGKHTNCTLVRFSSAPRTAGQTAARLSKHEMKAPTALRTSTNLRFARTHRRLRAH